MKKYIGTKQIEAEPMTMCEAYRRGLLQQDASLMKPRKQKLATTSAMKAVTKAGLLPTCSRKPTAWPIRFLTDCASSGTI